MILDKILEDRKNKYKAIMEEYPLEKLKNDVKIPNELNYRLYDLFKNKDFIFICECKKASPSKGLIEPNYHPDIQAKAYEDAGCDCISCLTEPTFFLGNNEHFKMVRENVKCPILRKDFIFSEYQIYESKKMGADIILLICAILDFDTLKKFLDLAHSLSLSCLVETHNEEEIDMAIKAGAKVIGVNNRNLKDFTVNTNLSKELRNKYKDIILISESGIKDTTDVKRIKDAGLNGVLVGEALMRSNDPKLTLKEFIEC